jgi:hypothetical protein
MKAYFFWCNEQRVSNKPLLPGRNRDLPHVVSFHQLSEDLWKGHGEEHEVTAVAHIKVRLPVCECDL